MDSRTGSHSNDFKNTYPGTAGSTTQQGHTVSTYDTQNQGSLPSLLSDNRYQQSRSPPPAGSHPSFENRVSSARPLPTLTGKDTKSAPQPSAFKSSIEYVLAKARFMLGTEEATLYRAGSRYKQVYELIKDGKALRDVLKLVGQHLDLYTAKHRLDVAYDERSKPKANSGPKPVSELHKLRFLAERIPQNEKYACIT